MDLGLPDGEGIDLIRRVRAWSPVPIVAMLLGSNPGGAEDCRAGRRGRDDYVTQTLQCAGVTGSGAFRPASSCPQRRTDADSQAGRSKGIDLARREASWPRRRAAPHPAGISSNGITGAAHRPHRQAGATDPRGLGSRAARRHAKPGCGCASRICGRKWSPTPELPGT